jgi:putative ABC transport system ATP-binding protein
MSALKAENIVKYYGAMDHESSVQALNGINLQVMEGEFIGVMGPSGSGKTTLLHILSGMDEATSGRVFISGKSLEGLMDEELALFRRQKMGYVFQDFNLMDSLTMKENIMLPLILEKIPANIMEQKCEDIMRFLEISHIADKYPYHVSGGQQQRAAVSRALINNPEIIFADEPTGNLDSKSSKAVMTSFEKMNEERHVTVMMVTHDAFAASFCKRIIFLKDGALCMEIVKKGTRLEFFDQILDCLAVLESDNHDL